MSPPLCSVTILRTLGGSYYATKRFVWHSATNEWTKTCYQSGGFALSTGSLHIDELSYDDEISTAARWRLKDALPAELRRRRAGRAAA